MPGHVPRPEQAALPEEPRSELRHRIIAAHREPEAEAVARLIDDATLAGPARTRVRETALGLVAKLRQHRTRSSGVDALMQEFSLSTREGIALMCLAEALLRVPDPGTADRLIRDKISHGDWRSHLGHSPSLFVNAAAWGLLLTGSLIVDAEREGLGSALTRLIARGGEPLIRGAMNQAMRLLGDQFVSGRTIREALGSARPAEGRGYRFSFDMLGEAALTAADAERYATAYRQAIDAIGRAGAGRGPIAGHGISIKLSALHPRYQWSQRDRVMSELLPRLAELCRAAREFDIGVNIDAEEADRLELSLDLFEALALDPGLDGWHGLGFVVQAYQKRAPQVLDWLIDLAGRSRRRIMLRLVKGAYWDSEIKRAQVDGLQDYPVFTRKPHTDLCYLACARRMLAARERIFPQFATHNAHTLAAVLEMAGDRFAPGDYEFQCLYGMGEALYDQVVGSGQGRRPVRIYAPVGSHRTLLAYLVRRLLENGANSSFVNRIVDERVDPASLVEDPVERARAYAGSPHPKIPLPGALYLPERRNSAGVDLSCELQRARLQAVLADARARVHSAAPTTAASADAVGPWREIRSPADRREVLGRVLEAGAEDLERALARATGAAPGWAAESPDRRAGLLLDAADELERNRDELVALAVLEAGKTCANGIAEVREAVDFLRYYASRSRLLWRDGTASPLGPVACISPWNFPLAIFTGQVAAALAAGNPVLAKPAEQTPLTAAAAVRALYAAGVPAEVLQLLPGSGEVVGARLVADHRVKGVIFTGSTEVAREIDRSLAQRGGLVPLVAETGGQNAMIVDSTALAEQVVADVLASAFDSAGQRCSALRVLCLQREIADEVLEMLWGAARELRLGPPWDLRVDVGPVIDVAARAGLEAHVAEMKRAGRRVRRLDLPERCRHGSFVAPTVIEIDSLDDLTREVFGPVLHVLRFRREDLVPLVARINATGYGLTMGVHSRIDETFEEVIAHARVGNLYVNRNMIGAVVGVQPFGGEGLSGTGPKAGGPLYLGRLVGGGGGPELEDPAPDPGRPALDALDHWLRAGGHGFPAGRLEALLATIERYRSRSPEGRRVVLPGPTGELNTLAFAPRGEVLGLAGDGYGLIHQLAAALATGNRLAIVACEDARALVATLPEELAAWVRQVADWRGPDFAAVLYDGPSAGADEVHRDLTRCDGAIVPLLRPAPDYPLWRLVAERALCVNTAAAGGNASLMTLGD